MNCQRVGEKDARHHQTAPTIGTSAGSHANGTGAANGRDEEWQGSNECRWVQMGTAATLQTSASVLSPAMEPRSTAVVRNILADVLEAGSPPACWLGSCQHLHRPFGGNALDLRSQGAYFV